ncbi:MAG: glycosyltransferase family 2 protein, partial [Planctomycetes bacterium]|nr:glycosyltransferase family 2 protein [Planctomycetota bacterium]
MTAPIALSIVIPAYNEAGRIGATLGRVGDYVRQHGLAAEALVVDDGSRDDTPRVVEGFQLRFPFLKLLRHETNHGKGWAVRTGMLAAQGERILFSDADLSTPIEEVEKLSYWLDHGYDIAI